MKKPNPVHDARRAVLRTYVALHYSRDGDSKGNVSAFAAAIKMPQSQIADMIDGRKAFGEKVAAKIATKLADKALPAIDFIGAPPAPQKTRGTPVMDFDPSAWDFARDWSKLADGPEKASIRTFLRLLVGEQERGKHQPKTEKAAATQSISSSRSKADGPNKNTLSSRKKQLDDPTH